MTRVRGTAGDIVGLLTTTEAQLALVVPQFFFPPTSLLGAIWFPATGELYFSHAILTTSLVVLTLYLSIYADDEGWSDYIAQAPDLIGSHLWCRLTLTHFSLQVDLSEYLCQFAAAAAA